MKKAIMAAVVITLSSITLHGTAQTAKKASTQKEERAIRKHEVDSRTLQQFSVDFPGVTVVSSTRNETISEISFTQNAVLYNAFYDLDNNLIGTTTQKQVSDLPQAALKSISKNYAGYTISKVIFFDDNEANDNDMWLYGKQFADADNYFAELVNKGKSLVLQITKDGTVFFFKNL